MKWHSLKLRFLTMVLLAVVIPFIMVLSFSYFSTARMMQKYATTDVQRSLERLQKMVSAVQGEQIRTVQNIMASVWSYTRLVSGLNYSVINDENWNQILTEFLANRWNIFDNCLWTNVEGHPLAKFIWVTDVAPLPFRDVFVETRNFSPEDSALTRQQKILKLNEVNLLPFGISKTGFVQYICFPFCPPADLENIDLHLGYLSFALRLDFLFNEATDRAQIPIDQIPIVFDAKGTILYHPEQKNICQKLNLIHPELSTILMTQLKISDEMLLHKHKDWLLAHLPQQHWILAVASHKHPLIAKPRAVYLMNGALILITLVLATFLLMFSMNKVTRSLAEVAAGANTIAQGDLNKRIPIRSNDEIGTLSRAFNTMAESLEAMIQERVEKEKLKELNELKLAFVSLVSHELRRPLGHILVATGNLRKGIGGKLSEKQSQYLDKVRNNTATLLRMINELLDLSRIEAGRIELELTSVPINSIITEIVDESYHLWQDKALNLEYDLTNTPTTIQADREKVKEIFSNLLDNAIKYTPAGGRITISSTIHEDDVEIIVADTGIGIPKECLEHIFERFYQVKDRRIEKDQGGLGLGLNIVKSFIELHRGSILIESEVDTGTKVTVRLPLLQQKVVSD